MAFEQDTDGFATHLGHQFSLDRLLGNQAHRPARLPRRRIRADHGDDALLLGQIQNLFGTWTRPFIQRPFQATFPVAPADVPHGLRREP